MQRWMTVPAGIRKMKAGVIVMGMLRIVPVNAVVKPLKMNVDALAVQQGMKRIFVMVVPILKQLIMIPMQLLMMVLANIHHR